MDYVYTFGDPQTLYLNVTNRCTNRCTFCVRAGAEGLGSGKLWGGPEPGRTELEAAIEDFGLKDVEQAVFCGFGEPTFRVDLIEAVGALLKERGVRVRLNTNGHAALINPREPDLFGRLARGLDEVSVSLNAPDAQRYAQVCRPVPSSGFTLRDYWRAMIEFIVAMRARPEIDRVRASVVGRVLTDDEIRRCRALAGSLGCAELRVR